MLPGAPPSIDAPRAWSQLGDFQVELNYPTVSTLIALDFASTCSSGPAYGPGGTFVQGGRPVACQGIETWGFMRRRATDWSCPVQPTYPTGYPVTWMGTHGITGTLGIDFLEYVPVMANPPDLSSFPRVLFDTYPVGFQISTGEIIRVGDRDKVTGTPGCTGAPAVNDPGDVWVVRPHYSALPVTGWELRRAPTPPGESQTTDGWEWGSAVIMYMWNPADSFQAFRNDRILRFGGVDPVADTSDPPMATLAAVWEFEPGSNPSSGTWRAKAPLTYARAWANAVALPTGQVFIVGGENNHVAPPVGGPQFVPELYDPGRTPTEPGSTLDLAMPTSVLPTHYPTPRKQHAVAILLPDARVLVAGGDDEDPSQYVASEHTGEIYSPPYLFYGFRPTILQAAAAANFSDGSSIETFTLSAQISPANSIERVVLIRPGAVTHHFDADQRYIELAFSVDQVTVPNPPVVQNVQLSVQSPDIRFGPPGRYMLFAIEKEPGPAGRRAPSAAEFIDVQLP